MSTSKSEVTISRELNRKGYETIKKLSQVN
jgi:hypothetical protein